MRIAINLATRPFVELRPLLLRLRYGAAALLLIAAALGVWLYRVHGAARVAEEQIAAVRRDTGTVLAQRQRNEARMQQPANRAVLDRSRFLNDIFAQKSFSWTAVMMDLERVLPTGVQVTSIEPQVARNGEVTIRLRVSGDRDRAVELVRNLEHSSRFLAPRLANESAQTTEAGLRNAALATGGSAGAVEFDILSGYYPLPPDKARSREPAHHESEVRR